MQTFSPSSKKGGNIPPSLTPSLPLSSTTLPLKKGEYPPPHTTTSSQLSSITHIFSFYLDSSTFKSFRSETVFKTIQPVSTTITHFNDSRNQLMLLVLVFSCSKTSHIFIQENSKKRFSQPYLAS